MELITCIYFSILWTQLQSYLFLIVSSGSSLNAVVLQATISASYTSHSIFSLGNYIESYCFIYHPITPKSISLAPTSFQSFEFIYPNIFECATTKSYQCFPNWCHCYPPQCIAYFSKTQNLSLWHKHPPVTQERNPRVTLDSSFQNSNSRSPKLLRLPLCTPSICPPDPATAFQPASRPPI